MELWGKIVVKLPGLIVRWEYAEPSVSAKIHRYRFAVLNICKHK